MYKTLFLSCFFGLYAQVSIAQSDSLSLLPQVQIVASNPRTQPYGVQSATYDSARLSLHQTRNLADLLAMSSGVYVKSYGLGSLATTAMRGASAGQTAVVWNGFPLQSPMLGQLDFALLPVVFVDNMTLQYGGNSAAWGSGAIGGNILLENNSQIINGLSVTLHAAAGSFGRQSYSTGVRYGNGRAGGSTRLFYEKAENDFRFYVHPDLPKKQQTNAALQQQGLLQEFFWKIKPNQELTLRGWLQNTDREIPPTIVQNRSVATQNDAFIRTALHWKRSGRYSVWQARAAYFSERLDYRDELIRLESFSKFHTWAGEAEAVWFAGSHWRLQGSLVQNYTRASIAAYERPPEQYRTALFAAVRREGKRWRAQLDGRLEVADGKLLPFTPGVGAEADVLRFLKIKGKIARTYRLPTFNDLYWRPGGNPDLLPESGWTQDLGLVFHGNTSRLRWQYSATGYQRRVKNWILWAQQSGQLFFSPQNIAEVWSRGLENRIELKSSLPFGEIIVSGGYDYTRSTNQIAIKSPRTEPGSQLFYVPVHRVFGEISFRYKDVQLTVFQQFTSDVIGLNEPVPSFTTGSLRLQYARKFGDWSGLVFLQIENIWNADYQVIERRPMPGRYMQAGMRTRFLQVK